MSRRRHDRRPSRALVRASDDAQSTLGPYEAALGIPTVKLGIVVQRYGADISGGAELHARYIAEHLVAHADVRVLTTCARDYVTWRNELPAGEERVNGIPVERFPVDRERNADLLDFGRRSTHVFTRAAFPRRRAPVARRARAREPGARQPHRARG